MRYRRLGTTDLTVSELCLGTMTWGQQNSEDDAHEQLDYAVEAGINFIDTAELYPVAPRAATYALTEQYIGTWLKGRGDRDKLVIATKALTNANRERQTFQYVRGGDARYDARNIAEAVDASLERLQTDHIDLYQLHWPERHVNIFGQQDYVHDADEGAWTPLREVLEALAEQVKAGKIRYVGVSNETPWGLMTYLKLAEQHGLPRVASVQNVYHLLNRLYEVGMAEISHREDVALLGYSPLAFGTLSGKYLDGQRPEGARMSLFPERYMRFLSPLAQETVRRYIQIAEAHDMTPSTLAIAFAKDRPFMTAPIIGATNLTQLRENIAAADVRLSPEVLAEIEEIHRLQPNPCP